MESKNFWKV